MIFVDEYLIYDKDNKVFVDNEAKNFIKKAERMNTRRLLDSFGEELYIMDIKTLYGEFSEMYIGFKFNKDNGKIYYDIMSPLYNTEDIKID